MTAFQPDNSNQDHAPAVASVPGSVKMGRMALLVIGLIIAACQPPTPIVSIPATESPTPITSVPSPTLLLTPPPPVSAKDYFTRGLTYYAQGDYDRAIADFDKAIQLEPDFAKAYSNRGSAYKSKGEKYKAIADFKKVLDLTDDPALRQQAQDQLKALGVQ